MTPSECAQVRDPVARNSLLTHKVDRLERELAYLRSPKRDPYEPKLVKRLRDRADRQRARAEMWKARALRRLA